MRRRFWLYLLSVMMFFCVGCRTDADFSINNDGSGSGKITLSGSDLSSEVYKSKLEESGFNVSGVEGNNGALIARVNWKDYKDIQKVFSGRMITRTENGDQITMDFGALDKGDLLLTVPGDIVNTTGVIDKKNKRRIHFSCGDKVVVIFKKGSAGSVFFGMMFWLSIIGIVLYIKRDKITEFLEKIGFGNSIKKEDETSQN